MILDLPPADLKALHAHAKGNWRAKAQATKQLRELAAGLTRVWIVQHPGHDAWDAALVTYRFFVPDRRQRDEANLIQSQKPAIDGVVDAGLLRGDDWTRLHIRDVIVDVDRDKPRVVLSFVPSGRM